MTDRPRRQRDGTGYAPGRPPASATRSAIPPPIEPGDDRAATAVLGAVRLIMEDFEDLRTRESAGVRLVLNSINYATAWRTVHGPEAPLPYNPGFAHCARRYLDLRAPGTALALIHRARQDGWHDDEFEALEQECHAVDGSLAG